MRHYPRKRFGQNFLRDESIIEAIARPVAPANSDHIVEIGPGEGALTQALISDECRLDAIELDRDLRTRLLAAFSTYPGVMLHSADHYRHALHAATRGRRAIGSFPRKQRLGTLGRDGAVSV